MQYQMTERAQAMLEFFLEINHDYYGKREIVESNECLVIRAEYPAIAMIFLGRVANEMWSKGDAEAYTLLNTLLESRTESRQENLTETTTDIRFLDIAPLVVAS